MKKTNKILILILLIMIIALSITGCEFDKKEIERIVINKNELNGYTEYVDLSGAKFSYPSEWQNVAAEGSQPQFANTLTGSSVNFIVKDIGKKYDIDEYMKILIENMKKQMEKAENNEQQIQIIGDVEEQKVVLNGKEASIIKYTVNKLDTIITLKEAYFIENKSAYSLTVACLESKYEENAEIMDNIISSFTK